MSPLGPAVRHSGPWCLAALAAVCATILTCCGERPLPVREPDLLMAGDGPALDGARLDQAARARLQGPLVLSSSARATVSLRVLRGAEPGEPGEGATRRVVVDATLVVPAEDGIPARRRSARVARPLGADGRGDQATTEEAIGRAIDTLGFAVRAAGLRESALVARLADPDPAWRLAALERVRDERVRTALEPLVGRVDREEVDVEERLAIVGALAAIGDRSAVPAMVRSARGQAPGYVSALLFAVARLGGKEAEAYVFTVASGHPDPELRKSAERALAELRR